MMKSAAVALTTVLQQDIAIENGGTATLIFDGVLRNLPEIEAGTDGFTAEVVDDLANVVATPSTLSTGLP